MEAAHSEPATLPSVLASPKKEPSKKWGIGKWQRRSRYVPDAVAYDLREFRRKVGISQTRLGELIGCSRYTVMRMELGRFPLRKPTRRRLEAWMEMNGYSSGNTAQGSPEEWSA